MRYNSYREILGRSNVRLPMFRHSNFNIQNFPLQLQNGSNSILRKADNSVSFLIILANINKYGHHSNILLRCTGGSDKSSARPGRKQATATKLGIYSTHSPWGSIHFLSRCYNFPYIRSPRQQRPPCRAKNGVSSFFRPAVVRRGQIRRI
jgi:hypothetical protein